jgi:hypothetical protein
MEVTGVAGAAAILYGCATATAPTIIGEFVCGLVSGLGAVGAILWNLSCIDDCENSYGPQPDPPLVGMTDGDDGEGEGDDEGEDGGDGYGNAGESPLPVMQT